MFKKFACIIIILSLGLLVACTKNEVKKIDNPNANPDSPYPEPVQKENNGQVKNVPKPFLDEKNSQAKIDKIPISAAAVDEFKLPGDVPVFANSEAVAKRITGRYHIFDYKVKATFKEVNDYYVNEMKNRGWALDVQMPNSADGLYFKKKGRTARVIIVNHPKDAVEYHIFVFDENEVEKASSQEIET